MKPESSRRPSTIVKNNLKFDFELPISQSKEENLTGYKIPNNS